MMMMIMMSNSSETIITQWSQWPAEEQRSCPPPVSRQPTFLVSRISRIVRCWELYYTLYWECVPLKARVLTLCWVFAGSLHTFRITRQLCRIFPRPDIRVRLFSKGFSYLIEVCKKSINNQLVIWLGEWQNSCNKLITIELSWSYLDPVKILFCSLIVCANCAALLLHSIKSSTLLLLSGVQEFEKLQYHAFTF